MKKIIILIFVCSVFTFMGCAEKPDTTDTSINETTVIEDSTEKDEISDEEYLINLGKRLKLGMTAQEVIEEIGEPDMDLGSGVTYLCYCQGDCTLWVCVFGKVSEVSVYNDKTDKTTYIYSIYEGETETAE